MKKEVVIVIDAPDECPLRTQKLGQWNPVICTHENSDSVEECNSRIQFPSDCPLTTVEVEQYEYQNKSV
jgi:hypothetical protein